MICFSYDPQTPKWGLQDTISNIKTKSLLSCILKPPFGGLGVTENKKFKKYINNNSLLLRIHLTSIIYYTKKTYQRIDRF